MSEIPDHNPNAEKAKHEAKAMKENVLKMLLTSEARQRLNNLKMVKPDVASMVENQLIQSATSGQIKHTITDDELKNILSSFKTEKRDFKMRWV
tara:strand:+ start:256 stop:537 length:282 start_codon:yes stop_codon:yes gene_type:complete